MRRYLLIIVFHLAGAWLSTAYAHGEKKDDANVLEMHDLVGAWEIEGVFMGEGDNGWVLPHKQSAPDCGQDHSVFRTDHTGGEITFDENCNPIEKSFRWKLEGNTLTLERGGRSIKWHIQSLQEKSLRVGVQVRPDSESRVYVVYNKKE